MELTDTISILPLGDVLKVIARVFPALAVGLGLILAGVWSGWSLARRRRLLFVRFLSWWLTRVIIPLLTPGPWLKRAVVIFLNNALLLAILVALGFHPIGAVIGAFMLGLSLGVALRVLSGHDNEFATPVPLSGRRAGLVVQFGVLLNLLEPPAILIGAGLSLGRYWMDVSSATAWSVYLTAAVPLLLLAAGGEALWLGACRVKPLETELTTET